MTPDEIARLFDRRTGMQVALIDGLPVALARTNYDTDEASRRSDRSEASDEKEN